MKTNEPGIEKIEGKKGPIYRVQVRKKGHKQQSRSFSSFREAKKWKLDTLNALASGGITDTAVMRRTTLGDLINRYIEVDLDPTSSNYKTRLGQLLWWSNELGHCIATNLTEDLISHALEKLQKTPDRYGKPRKPATINRYSTTLSCVLEKSHRHLRLITRNPIKNLKKKREQKQKKRVLSFSECQTLINVCKTHPAPYVLPLVTLLLCTGFRKNEALTLQHKHISIDKGEILLECTKNGDSRVVPLVEPALSYLKDYLQSHAARTEDLIFPGRNKNKPINFRATWNAITTQAGINNFTIHCTRYTAVSLLSELKVPLHIISQIVGHKTLAMTMHYTNPSSEFIRTSLEDLGRKLGQ